MTHLRYFLVFQAFLFWQGGFLFYSAVVVPTGTDVVGSDVQGFITQEVTNWMTVIGLFWHLLFAWDLLATHDPFQRRAKLRFLAWLVSFVALGALVFVHNRLDLLLEEGRKTESSQDWFRIWHGVYLWTATGQWILGMLNAWWTLGAWTQHHVQTPTA